MIGMRGNEEAKIAGAKVCVDGSEGLNENALKAGMKVCLWLLDE
jgi:hypothetical protein